MTTGLYDSFYVGVDLLADDIRLVPVSDRYRPDFVAHATLADVPAGARSAEAEIMTARVLVGLTFDAADVTFPGVPEGEDILGFLMYKHTGNEATSTLVGYFDYFSNLPLTPDGRPVVVAWPDTVYRIFTRP